MKLTSKGLSTFRKKPIKQKQISINKFISNLKTKQKPKSSQVLISSNKKRKIQTTNTSKKKIKAFKIISQKINPFKEKKENLNTQKKRNILKPLSSKVHEFKFNINCFKKINNFWEDNYINEDISELNNIMPTIETETNRYISNKKFNYDLHFNTFKNSVLMSTIIMDNEGNNNFNCEQKKIIEGYFDKKKKLEKDINKCKINKIKVEKYNSNNIHIKQNKSQMNHINKRNFSNLKISDCNFNKNKIQFPSRKKGNKAFMGRKILSMKENLLIRDLLENNDVKDKDSNFVINSDDESEENNSIFENCQKKSNDSSFLSSSEGHDLIMAFKESDFKH